MTDRIDIGNVRGIKGDKGDKGEKGSTPSYDDLKYQKQNDEFVTVKGTGSISQLYIDAESRLCDENGYLLDENRQSTDVQGTAFTGEEYLYKEVWVDDEGNFTTEYGDLLDEDGNFVYVESDFVSDVIKYIYDDDVAYNQLVGDVSPQIVDTLLSADPEDGRYQAFFDEIEGNVKYYICDNSPQVNIYMDDGVLVNNCHYLDENGNPVSDENENLLSVPLERNALYLYNTGLCDNDIMHYDIYICVKANTVPVKLISCKDFEVTYNTITGLNIVEHTNEEEENDVCLQIITTEGDGTSSGGGSSSSISLVDSVIDDDTTHAVTGNAVHDYIESIIGDADDWLTS